MLLGCLAQASWQGDRVRRARSRLRALLHVHRYVNNPDFGVEKVDHEAFIHGGILLGRDEHSTTRSTELW